MRKLHDDHKVYFVDMKPDLAATLRELADGVELLESEGNMSVAVDVSFFADDSDTMGWTASLVVLEN